MQKPEVAAMGGVVLLPIVRLRPLGSRVAIPDIAVYHTHTATFQHVREAADFTFVGIKS